MVEQTDKAGDAVITGEVAGSNPAFSDPLPTACVGQIQTVRTGLTTGVRIVIGNRLPGSAEAIGGLSLDPSRGVRTGDSKATVGVKSGQRVRRDGSGSEANLARKGQGEAALRSEIHQQRKGGNDENTGNTYASDRMRGDAGDWFRAGYFRAVFCRRVCCGIGVCNLV